MTISAGTVVSSLLSNRMVARFGTAKVTTVSVLMTAVGLVGYSLAGQAAWLFLWAIPLGLGAGSVDAALNNFVALHYKSMHMNWLHCFWGVGATAGPIIMSFFLANGRGWRTGYGVIAGLQFALVLVLFASLRLWQGRDQAAGSKDGGSPVVSNREALGVPLVKLALVSFACFSITEATTGLWSSSYLVGVHGMAPAAAARWTASFYGGITVGRLLSGFLSMKLKNAAPDPRRAAGLRGRGSSAHAAGPCSTFCLRDCSDRFGDSPYLSSNAPRNAQSLWSSRLWRHYGSADGRGLCWGDPRLSALWVLGLRHFAEPAALLCTGSRGDDAGCLGAAQWTPRGPQTSMDDRQKLKES
jgi:MFS family permease